MTIPKTRLIKPQRLLQRTDLLNQISSFVEDLPPSAVKISITASLFKKIRSEKPDRTLAEKAKQTFLITEKVCGAFNIKIRNSLARNQFFADSEVLHLTARKISRILGPFSIDKMLDLGRFGPGSTYNCRGFDVSRARKFSLTDVSPEFNKIARGLLAEYPSWAASLAGNTDSEVCPILDVVPGGRYSTVRKDARTDRSIIVEPTINSWFQQGLGRYIRERLSLASVDLNSQELNQRLAKLGSVSDDLATVDLSSASDLICTKLVEFLLPPDWFFWLNLTRSRRVKIDDKWIELEKFSSMGNGFTFDLESLIFYCLAHSIAVSDGFNPFWVNSFGDDIVIPSGCYEKLIKVFSEIGFTVNLEKSFHYGPFRESCGKDYHLGQDVRGVYIKDFNTDLDLMKIHNRMYEWAIRTGNFEAFQNKLRPKILTSLKHLDARVPPSLGDVGIFSSFDEIRPALYREQWEAYRYKCLLPVLSTRTRSDRSLLLDRLQGSDFDGNESPLRQEPIGYRYREVVA